MAGFITAEGLIVPASTDLYNLTPDLRTMANSIRSVVSVANAAGAGTVASAMSADGRTVTALNPLIFWDQSRNLLKVMDATHTYSSEDAFTKLTLNTPVSLASGSFTTISWDTAIIQPDVASWAAGANPDRIKATVPGIYEVTVLVGIQTAGITTGTSRLGLQVIQSGSVSRTEGTLGIASADGSVPFTTYLQMAALDYIQVQIFQETGSAKNTGSANYSKPIVTLRKI